MVDDPTGSSWERVRSGFPENVPHVGAGRYFQLATAHPHLQHRGRDIHATD